ncbi:MAG: FlgD immunoglobulin-like domain containing protein [Ignavibacteriaceae bacterium]
MKHFLSITSLHSALVVLILSIGVYAQVPTPTVGDYGSVASGNWSAYATTFRQWDGTGWNTVPTGGPGSSHQTFILTGTTVTYDKDAQKSTSLIIQAGAVLKSDSVLQTNGLTVISLTGSPAVLWVDGTFGSPTDALMLEQRNNSADTTLTIGGSGTINIAQLRPYSSGLTNPHLIIAANVNFNYSGSNGLGGAGIYTSRGSINTYTITVNLGDTVNFAPNCNLMMSPTSGALGKVSTILNIEGTINMPSSNAVFADSATKTCSVNIGSTGALNVGKYLTPYITGVNNDGTVASINVANGGSLNILNGGTADFTNPGAIITGTGSFTLNTGGTLNIGAVAGLDAASGPIQTTGTNTFSTGANFSYIGTSPQTTGSLFPDTVNNLTINDTAGVATTDSLAINGALTINGKLINDKGIKCNGTATVNGIYQHNMDGGIIPIATWNTGSTCLVTGTKTLGPTGANQNFYNFNVACDSLLSQSYPAHFDMASNTIAGTVTIQSTNSTNHSSPLFYALTGYEVAGSPKTITINGNFVVDTISSIAIDDFSSSHGTESVTLLVKGDLNVSGNVSLCPGSAKNLNNLVIMGNVNLQTGSSFYSHSKTTDSLIFAGTSTQTYRTGVLTNNNYINTNILSGAIVDMDTSIFTGSSSTFTVQPGATIATGHTLGLNGNINVGGAKSLSNAANYIFNGSIAQITGTFLPDSVANLTINNAAGVVLSQATTVNDTLFLKSGLFDNTIPFTQGSNFKLVTGNGSLKDPITAVDNAKVLPLSFKVEQNYPNPFNPSTTINFSLKSEAVVTIKIYSILGKEVRTLVNEERPSGNYCVLWNGCDNAGISVASGTYFYRYTAGNITQVRKMVLLK